jgi:hypothetical protein
MKLVAEVKTQTIENGFGIFIAPYISPAAIQVCREAGIGCMDLSGNVFLSFGNVFKDKIGELLNFSYIGRDVGIAGAVTKRHIMEERGEAFGRAFEHFILMELAAHASYRELHYGIRYWRTKTGQEIDFILGDGEIALRSLAVFMEEYSPKAAIVVSNETQERRVGKIRVAPWRSFLSELWEGGIIR